MDEQITSQLDSIDIGKSVKRLETSPDWGAFTKVILRVDDDGNTVTAGNDTGLTLEAECHWATAQTAQDILDSLSGYRYSPYKAESAILNPAAELGDRVIIDGGGGGLYTMSKNFGGLGAVTIGAPARTEEDREIVHVNHTDRRFQRKMADISASFSAQGTQINTALKDAKDASDAASEANTLASTANTNANQAKDQAQAAYNLAASAKDTADDAATAATAANTLATTANSNATAAKDITDRFTASTDRLIVDEYIQAPGVYADILLIKQNNISYSASLHTHSFHVDNNGRIHIEGADWSGADHFFNIADTQYYQNGVSAAYNDGKDDGAETASVKTLATGAAGTPVKNQATNKWYALIDVTGTAQGTYADGSTYTSAARVQPLSTDVTAVYNKGYADGGGGGTHSIDFGNGVTYNAASDEFQITASCGGTSDTYNMTPTLGWSGAPNEWDTPQTNWMRVYRYIDLNGVASQDFAIDVDMTTQINGAYSSGHSAGYSSGYSAGSGAVTVYQVLGYGSNVARIELSNGSRWRIESDGTITRLN